MTIVVLLSYLKANPRLDNIGPMYWFMPMGPKVSIGPMYQPSHRPLHWSMYMEHWAPVCGIAMHWKSDKK